MSVVLRGARNALRNPVRTGSIILLLGVATAFALSLLLANQAVKAKIESLKTTGATTLSLMPAGATSGPGLQGGGEPLTTDMLEKVKDLEHVADTGASLGGGMRVMIGGPAGDRGMSTNSTFEPPKSEIDLESPIDAGSLGRRQLGAHEDMADFKLPVQANGVSGNLDPTGKNYVLESGDWFTDDGYQAVLGKDLASHNKLSVGDTFTAYDKKFTVVGIYDASDTFRNAIVLMPLKTFQTLSERTNEVGSIVVKVDSIDNMEAVETAIKNALGKDEVDITSSAQSTEDAINSLKSIQNISVAGVVIAVIAAGTIVFMVMTMIVRERKKEIAVLKAIGGSNLKITGQFVTEAVVLTLCSVVIGSLIALASSNSLTNLLVTTNTTDSTANTDDSPANMPGGGMRRMVGGPAAAQAQTTSAEDLLKDVSTDVGAGFLIQGLAAVVLIGALGSAIPAYAISKVRPAEVMRGE
jgi:putative ABC transport system permease protein